MSSWQHCPPKEKLCQVTLHTHNITAHLLMEYTLRTNKKYYKNAYTAFWDYMIDGVVDGVNPRLHCVCYGRNLMSIIFISVRPEARVVKGGISVRLMELCFKKRKNLKLVSWFCIESITMNSYFIILKKDRKRTHISLLSPLKKY